MRRLLGLLAAVLLVAAACTTDDAAVSQPTATPAEEASPEPTEEPVDSELVVGLAASLLDANEDVTADRKSVV